MNFNKTICTELTPRGYIKVSETNISGVKFEVNNGKNTVMISIPPSTEDIKGRKSFQDILRSMANLIDELQETTLERVSVYHNTPNYANSQERDNEVFEIARRTQLSEEKILEHLNSLYDRGLVFRETKEDGTFLWLGKA